MIRARQIGIDPGHFSTRLFQLFSFAALIEMAMVAVGVYGPDALRSMRYAAARLLVAVSLGIIALSAFYFMVPDKSLWTDRSFKDFVLQMEWKLKLEPGYKNKVPVILPSGDHLTVDGKEVRVEIDDVDSGVYLRGSSKSQVNIWMWPIGSGEVYGYRMDKKMSPEIRAGVTPKKKMDKPVGEWNTFEITMKGDRLTVKLNGEEVIANAQLPGVPAEGPLALQHHGGWDAKNMRWSGPPSIVQFKNVYIKELK